MSEPILTVYDNDGNEIPILAIKGDQGETGAAATIDKTVDATIDNNVGTPSVTVTNTGTTGAAKFKFDFKNLKGEKGDSGTYVGSDPVPSGTIIQVDPSGEATNIADKIDDGTITYSKFASDTIITEAEVRALF